MNTTTARTFLHGFVGFLTVVAAIFLVPIVLLISLCVPFTPWWMGPVLIVLAYVVFAFWLIKAALRGQLNRKESPFSFYAAVATNVLFLCTAAATVRYVQARGSSSARVLRSLDGIRHGKSVGLLAGPSRKQKLLRNFLRMEFLRPLLLFKDDRSAAILDYRVSSYDSKSLEYLFEEVFLRQEYFFATDSKRPLVIDCGSHIGTSVLYAKALYPDAQVIAFEPAPDNFRLLRENVERNALADVTLVNKALADKEGTMKFYGDDSMVASLLESRKSGKSATEVEVVKLSTYIDRPVDFLKMDIEGAEDMVLEDLAAADKLKMVKQMIVEYHHHNSHLEKGAHTLSRFLKTLEDNNFGYQIEGACPPPYGRMAYEDVMIYAYQK